MCAGRGGGLGLNKTGLLGELTKGFPWKDRPMGRAGRKLLCGGGGGDTEAHFPNPPPSLLGRRDGRGGSGRGCPTCRARGGGVNPTSMAQNDTHVALIILTTQSNFQVAQLFRGPACGSAAKVVEVLSCLSSLSLVVAVFWGWSGVGVLRVCRAPARLGPQSPRHHLLAPPSVPRVPIAMSCVYRSEWLGGGWKGKRGASQRITKCYT